MYRKHLFVGQAPGKKAPLNHNDFLGSIWRGFLYSAAMEPGPIAMAQKA